MDDSWRFRPIQSNICPVCSISHFPFCPPPPAFDRSRYPGEILRRYPPDIDPSFHRPLHDLPLPDHRPPLPFRMPSVSGAEPWSGSNLPMEREPLRPDFYPSPRFYNEELLERESFHKRMRVEDPALGKLPPLPTFNRYDLPPNRISSDDERMLNLIRDHGQQSTATYEAGSRYQHRNIGTDHGFYDLGLGSAARNGPVFPPEPQFSHQNRPLQANSYEGFRNFPMGPSSHCVDSFLHRRDVQRGEFDTSRSGVFNPHIGEDPYGRNRQFDTSSELPQSYHHGVSIKDSENHAAHVPVDRSLYDSLAQVSYTARDYDSRGPYGKYYGHNHQQLHLNESSSSVLPKQPQYPHNDSNQLPPNLATLERESSHPFNPTRHPIENRFELHGQHAGPMRTPLELMPLVHEEIYTPFDSQTYPLVEQSGGPSFSKQGGYLPMPAKSINSSMPTAMLGQVHNPQTYPPLPLQPLMEVHDEPPTPNFQVTSSMSAAPPVLNHAPTSTPVTMSLPPNTNFSEPHPLPQTDSHKEPHMHASTGFANEGSPFIHQTPSKRYSEEGGHTFPFKHSLKDKATIIDASHLFKQPSRASRPDYIVIILRGLPGSGKSYLAKAIRDIEVENGGNAPRIHAMDDYFMMEVEKKVEDNDGSKSSSSFRGKKQITKKVVEYCYEPEMEEELHTDNPCMDIIQVLDLSNAFTTDMAYRSSMLKAFKKTLDEGIFTVIIVDDRNLRVADFAQFWAIAKRSGYEVYLLEAAYKDPAGCAARNVHGFTLDDIQKMAEQWEEAPSLYLQLDIQSLFHGDDLNKHSIEEVDMDTDDAACDEEDMRQLQDGECLKMTGSKSLDYPLDGGFIKVGDRWDTEEDDELPGVKELERSKWLRNLDEDTENPDDAKENLNALSGLLQAYGKSEKSVHWGDRVDKGGFSIGAVKKKSISSLIIGPGSGYNLNSNPLLEGEDAVDSTGRNNISDSKRRFHEQLRAERDSFKAVFDGRRQRIGGLFNADDE